MQPNNLPDELSIDLLTNDFNSRSFLMFLRRQSERYREISTSQHDRQYPSKYCEFDNSRGFARLIEFQPSNSKISSYMTMLMTEELSQQLIDDNLKLVRYHWQQSKTTFTNKIEHIQSELNLQTNTSFKRTINDCHKLLSNWISKNRVR